MCKSSCEPGKVTNNNNRSISNGCTHHAGVDDRAEVRRLEHLSPDDVVVSKGRHLGGGVAVLLAHNVEDGLLGVQQDVLCSLHVSVAGVTGGIILTTTITDTANTITPG